VTEHSPQAELLLDYVRNLENPFDIMKEYFIKQVIYQVLLSLAKLHSTGIAHLNVNPSTILLM